MKTPVTPNGMKLTSRRPQAPALLTPGRKIFNAAFSVAACAAIAGLGSTAKELVVAHWFGRGDALDAFLIAFLLPSFLVNLVAGSFNSAMIPTFIEVREREGNEAAQRLFSGVMVVSLGLLVGVSILVGILASHFLPLLGSGFSPAKLMLTRRLLYALLPFIALSGLAVAWTAVLNAGEHFGLPALSGILTPLSIIAFLLLLGRTWGVFTLAVGTVTGVAIQAAVLGWLLRERGVRLEPRWYGWDPGLRKVIGQYVPMLAGAMLMGSTELVDQSMAAMLQPGSVAALNYARKVVSLFIVVGATPLSTAALPYFSQMVAKQDWSGCRQTLKTYSRSIVLVTVPITLGLVVFSHPLIKILFQRGAFTAVDTNIVSRVQSFLSLQIPFYILASLGVRLVSALKRNSVLMVIAGVNMVLNIIFNLILMRYAGVAGIALSTSFVYLVSCALIYASIATSLRRLDRPEEVHGNSSL
jgi:putative peptidoglycan lipid II flippase